MRGGASITGRRVALVALAHLALVGGAVLATRGADVVGADDEPSVVSTVEEVEAPTSTRPPTSTPDEGPPDTTTTTEQPIAEAPGVDDERADDEAAPAPTIDTSRLRVSELDTLPALAPGSPDANPTTTTAAPTTTTAAPTTTPPPTTTAAPTTTAPPPPPTTAAPATEPPPATTVVPPSTTTTTTTTPPTTVPPTTTTVPPPTTTTTTTTTTTEPPRTGPFAVSADGSSGLYDDLPSGAERARWVDCDPFAGVWVCATRDLAGRPDRRAAYNAALGI